MKQSQIEPRRPSEFLFAFILVVVVGWLLYTYRVLFGPLIIAALVAYLLYPGVSFLARHTKIKRRQVVLIVYLVFLGFLVWAGIFLVPVIANQANLFSRQLTSLPGQIRELDANLDELLGFDVPLNAFIEEIESDIGQLLNPNRAFRLILSATTNIVWVVVIFLTSFHLLRDWEELREWSFGLLPVHLEPELRMLHHEIKLVWQSYLRGQLLIMFFLGLLSGIGTAAIGLPSALLLGFCAGALALIPSLGPATATAIAAVVAWTQGSSTLALSNQAVTILVVLIFQVVQMIEGFWLTPRIMGRRMRLHPGVVLIAIIGTLFTFGALVALIIVPIIASLVQIVGYARRKQAGLDPWPTRAGPETNVDAELT